MNAQPSIVNAENPYPILNDIFHFFINYSDMAIALLGPNGDHAFVNRAEGHCQGQMLSGNHRRV